MKSVVYASLLALGCAPELPQVSIARPDSVTVTVSAPVSASVAVSVPASASVAEEFPAGWYDGDDGSVVRLASRAEYALGGGRDVEPRALLGEGFVRDVVGVKWTGRELVIDCTGRETEEAVEITAREGSLRIATLAASECVPRSVRVLTPIAERARVVSLEALMAEASSPRACEALARCCRSLRGRELLHTNAMCSQPTSSSIECHDRRLEIATALRSSAGPCIN